MKEENVLNRRSELRRDSRNLGRRRRIRIGEVLCVFTLLAAASWMTPAIRAQVTSGTIFGTVQDPTGAMIPNATITASERSKGITRTGTSSSTGTFSLPNLPPGTYTVDKTHTVVGFVVLHHEYA